MGMVGLAGAVADPEHVAGGGVPVAGRGIDPGHGLLVAEQQRLVAGVEIGRAHLGMRLWIDADGPHEVQALGDPLGELGVARGLRRILHEAEHPAMRILEIGIAAGGEGADQVERRRRLAVGHELAARIGRAGLGREGDVADNVAAVARQFDAVDGLGRGRARLGELAGDAADLHHRRTAGIGEHHRHLEEETEEIADVVRRMLGEALGAIAALEQEGLALGDLGQGALQLAGFARKHQRGKAGELLLDALKRLKVRKGRNLLDRPVSPAVGRPPLAHDTNPRVLSSMLIVRRNKRHEPAPIHDIFKKASVERPRPGDDPFRRLKAEFQHFPEKLSKVLKRETRIWRRTQRAGRLRLARLDIQRAPNPVATAMTGIPK